MDKNLTCQHGGQCILVDEYMISNQKYVCICSKGYIGNRCEIAENKIILSFENSIILTQSIFIYFIEVINDGQSVCENDGQCFQDTLDCPQRSMCICSACFYGTRCQFSSNGFGLINRILALITFKNKMISEILILTQMAIISNKLFLQIQCISLDCILQVCLNMDQWLNAFVAIE
ncbi:unnamed protein product [Rotaria sp. Silwood1]|nr:unnamed protein product [Rotaria sp. Silwood1]CAF4626691.1 unnamed protein product [Rotaria sp. Silwood1]